LIDNQKFQLALEKEFNSNLEKIKKYILGSPIYDSLSNANQKLLENRDNYLAELDKKYPTSFFSKFKKAGQNPKVRYTYRPDGTIDSSKTIVNYRLDWWNDFDFSDERLVRTPVFFNKLKKYINDFTVQMPDSVIASADYLMDKTLRGKEFFKIASNWISYQYKPGLTKMMDGEAVYSHLILKYFTPELTGMPASDLESVRKTATEMLPSFIGKVGQDVRCQNKNDEYKSLYDLNAAIKVVFIYNPECEHCQEQAPQLRQIYDQWKSKGVEIYSIASNAKSKAEWQNFAQKYGVNWTDVWDPYLKSRYHEKYYVDITPEIYVLDKNNIIVAKNLKPEQLPEIFQREFAKLK
jgi:peroxiredoxin